MKIIKTCFVVFSGLSYLYGPALTFADCNPKPAHPCAGLVYEPGAMLYSDNAVGKGTKKIRDLNLGDFFFIVGSSGTWFQVDPLKGGKGWVEKQYIHTYYVSLLTGKANTTSQP